MKTPLPYSVIMLDEVHERGRNVDLCMSLLSNKLGKLDEKFKIILCSATIDPNIKKLFQTKCKVGEFEKIIVNNKISREE
jgi:HrpA-like RNA helicase